MYKAKFFNNLKKSLKKKNILIDQSNIYKKNTSFYLYINSFLKYRKLSKLKKKKKKIKKYHLSNISLLLEKFFNLSNKPLIYIKINILNNMVKIKKKFFFFTIFKKFKYNLFTRRPDLFFDFLNLSALLIENKISITIYLEILSQIFNILLKKKHSLFFMFLKLLFKQLTLQKLNHKLLSAIRGIKFWISGKLKGKDIATTLKIIEGKVPCKNADLQIQYSRIQVYNRYGVYGLKIWLNTRKNEILFRK